MAIENLHDFLSDFFTANQCEILENENGKMHVQLNDKMDELLMNRPFYWQYVKKLGYPGEPMKVTFITNPDRQEEDGEWIHFGSPRIHQIFNTLTSQGKFTKLFQQVNGGQRTAMIPWLVVNIKISYNGKHKKDEIKSIGLQMINGAMHTTIMETLEQIPFQNSISDFCYTLTPIIRLKSGFQRISKYIENYLETKDHEWAEESWNHLQEEKKLLERFYFESEDSDFENRFDQELKDLEGRFKPKINMEVINGGLFYLSQTKSNKMII